MKLSIQKDQRGLSGLTTILVLIIVVAVGAGIWKVIQNSHDNSLKARHTKVTTDICNQQLKDKDLCKFIGNYDIGKLSYVMKINSESKTNNLTASPQNQTIIKSVTTLKSDGKGNSQLSGTSSGQASEVVYFNKVTYMKDQKDGKWWKFAANDVMAPKNSNPVNGVKFSTPAAKSTIRYKKLDKEACGSLTCFKYQIVDSAHPKDTTYFWFDNIAYYLQGYYNKAADGTVNDLSISYQSVDISAPSPTKDVPTSDTNAQTQLQQFNQNYTGPNVSQ
jgi:hypothetical protein